MAIRKVSTLAALLASAAWPGYARAQPPAGNEAAVSASQVAPAGAADPVATEQIRRTSPHAPGAVGINQLPANLQPLARGNEEQLGGAAGPPRSLTADVVTAWHQIRTRGQTPTPDLIAREIGPDKLAEFLATSPAAASILATGVEPDPPAGPAADDKTNGAAIRVIVPPGQS